jgi:mannosyl-oligosaccharide glucosidase
MSKQRKPHPGDKPPKAPRHEAKVQPPPPESQWKFSMKTVLTFVCLGVACCIGYKGYLETRVNTPFDNRKVVVKSGLASPARYWGSYRPANYFGLKTREPHSPVVGLMWYFPKQLRPSGEGIR